MLLQSGKIQCKLLLSLDVVIDKHCYIHFLQSQHQWLGNDDISWIHGCSKVDR